MWNAIPASLYLGLMISNTKKKRRENFQKVSFVFFSVETSGKCFKNVKYWLVATVFYQGCELGPNCCCGYFVIDQTPIFDFPGKFWLML